MATKKAVKAKEVEVARTTVDISLIITTLDGSVVGKDFTIVNPGGCMSPLAVNNPTEVVDTLRDGLIAKYGINSIRE